MSEVRCAEEQQEEREVLVDFTEVGKHFLKNLCLTFQNKTKLISSLKTNVSAQKEHYSFQAPLLC